MPASATVAEMLQVGGPKDFNPAMRITSEGEIKKGRLIVVTVFHALSDEERERVGRIMRAHFPKSAWWETTTAIGLHQEFPIPRKPVKAKK